VSVTASKQIALNRADLSTRRQQSLVDGTVTKADLWVTTLPDGTAAVVKDFSKKPFWIRPWGRLQIAREIAFLRRLAGIEGIPRLLGRLDADGLVTEFIPGKALFLCRKRVPREHYVRQLREILAAVHAHGIVHNDLRGRENVHVADLSDRVYLLDWAGAVRLPPGSIRHRLLFDRWKSVDEAAVLKWKMILIPEELSNEERRFLQRFLFWRRLWPVNRKGTGRAGAVR
jgi:serine/threonine protein kinase